MIAGLTYSGGFTILNLENAKAFLLEDVFQMEITSEQNENANGNVKVCCVTVIKADSKQLLDEVPESKAEADNTD